MDRFEYSDTKLLPGELFVMKISNVKLCDGDEKSPFENGNIMLTTHRLIWSGINNNNKIQLNLSVWLKYIIYVEQEKSSFAFVNKNNKKLILFLMEIPEESHLNGPFNKSIYNFVKLSFKDNIDMDFATALTQTIREKRWETQQQTGGEKVVDNRSIKLRTGIVGIERNIEEKQKADNQNISIAFEDLSKLMTMAKDMVNLSKSISNKLKDKQGDITDDETVKFKSYLLGLGIEDPVTRDSFRTEYEYYQKLANEISQIIQEPLKEVGGIMVLTDVFCRVNRARGLELLSPEDFLSGYKMLERCKLPVILKQFDSGVNVLQLNSVKDEIVVEDKKNILLQKDNASFEELARWLGISVLLAKQRLLIAEKFGVVCRDDIIEGLRFFPNKFLNEN